MSDNPVTRRKLMSFLRDAYWSDLTAKDATEAGIDEADHAAVLKFAKEIRAAYAGGSLREALEAMDEAVEALGDITFGERSDSLNPRQLAARAAGDPVPDDDRDEMDPRKLAEHLEIY